MPITSNGKHFSVPSLDSGHGFGEWYGRPLNFLHPQQFLITDFDKRLKCSIQNNDVTLGIVMTTPI